LNNIFLNDLLLNRKTGRGGADPVVILKGYRGNIKGNVGGVYFASQMQRHCRAGTKKRLPVTDFQ